MKYKLLVLDVDGTLLNDEREISKRTLAALLKVQQMGVRIVLASGRPTYGLMSLAKTLELGNYGGFVLSYNGCARDRLTLRIGNFTGNLPVLGESIYTKSQNGN